MTAAESIAAYRASITEAQFQRTVMDIARTYGWRIYHARPAMMRSGQWATATDGDVGWPDLAMARKGRLILAELKSQKGRVKPEQQAWISALLGWSSPDGTGDTLTGDAKLLCGAFAIYLWRPSDLEDIKRVLR